MSEERQMQYDQFLKPAEEFRSVPFWSLNDYLQPEEIQRQLAAFQAGGFGGAYLHSRIGLLTEYLGPDWWTAMDTGVETCGKLGLEAWFYDEDKWPSGFAGGLIPRMSEDYRARALLRLDKSNSLPVGGEVLAEDELYQYISYTDQMGAPWFNGTCWVDLLNPAMVKAFIECSYQPYAERYEEQTSGAVKGIFTDEPQISPRETPFSHLGAISYSPVLRSRFKEKHGYDIVDHLPALFEETPDHRTIRLDYYRALASLLEESFSKQIGEYCEQHKLTWTGHFNAEESPSSVLRNVGNMMVQYRHMQRPGIDHLGLRIAGGVHAAKSLSSVANQYGISRRLSELFGISGQNMNFEDRKWIADWHAVLGINHFCPHLSLYSMRGCRKRDYPPTFSPQQPYWQYNKLIEDYMARVCYATTCGQFAPEVLVLHPLESTYIEYSVTLVDGTNQSPTSVQHRDQNLRLLLEELMQQHRDFDLGDEQILADIGKIVDGQIQVGAMSYQAVILPFMTTIRRSTLNLVENFSAIGGPVLVIGGYPTLVDGEPDDEALAFLSKTAALVTLNQLPTQLADMLPPAVRIEGAGAHQVWSQRRRVGDGQLLHLCNTSRLQPVTCRVTVENTEGSICLLDPVDGQYYRLLPVSDGSLVVHLSESQSVVITIGVETEAPINGNYHLPETATEVLNLDGLWQGHRLAPNSITLDYAKYSTDGGAHFGTAEPVIGIHERLTEQQYRGLLWLDFSITVERLPSQCRMVLEQPSLYSVIRVNGEILGWHDIGEYRDSNFRMTDITHQLRTGANSIRLQLDYVAPIPDSYSAVERYGTEIEAIYLVGDFAVMADLIADASAQSQRNQEGALPQRPVHRMNSFRLTTEQREFSSDLVKAGYPFFNGAFQLEKEFDLPIVEPGKRYHLVFPDVEAIVIIGELNGISLPATAWSPWEMEITAALRAGTNRLRLTLVNSLRNLLGPHHHCWGELTSVGPDSFGGRTTWCANLSGEENWYDIRLQGQPGIWREDYHVIPFGLLRSPQIVVR